MAKQITTKPGLCNANARSRLLSALDLMELGIAIKRQNITRKMPSASRTQINTELQYWLKS